MGKISMMRLKDIGGLDSRANSLDCDLPLVRRSRLWVWGPCDQTGEDYTGNNRTRAKVRPLVCRLERPGTPHQRESGLVSRGWIRRFRGPRGIRVLPQTVGRRRECDTTPDPRESIEFSPPYYSTPGVRGRR